MRSDAEIRRDVESELQRDPSVDDSKVGVIVNSGVVTLTGEVGHFAGKLGAEDITKRVSGVRAIANDLQVKMPRSGERSDTEIAQAAANALQWHVSMGGTQIKPVVRAGWVTLSGNVSWGFQRTSAENAVRNLPSNSVAGLTNGSCAQFASIFVELENQRRKVMRTDIEIRRDVESELQWEPSIDDKKIGVIVNDGVVTLTGEVKHFAAKQAAEDITKRVSSVTAIANEI